MRWITLGFVFFMFVIDYADKAIAGFAAIPISKEFGLSPIQWGIVGSSFFWSFIFANIFGGTLADKFGTKKVLTFTAITWTVLQLCSAAITNLPMLIAYRILLGIFEGPFYATAITHLNKFFAPEKRGMATAILNFGSPVGSLVSAPILVYLINHFGWHVAFASLGVCSFVWLLLWIFFGKEQPEGVEKDNRLVKKMIPVKQKLRFSDFSAAMLTRTFLLTTLVSFSTYWFSSWSSVWMPTYLVKALNVSSTQMANVAAIAGLTAGFVGIGISLLSDYVLKQSGSHTKSRVMVVGFSLLFGSILLYSITVVHSAAWAMFVMCAGAGFFHCAMSLNPHIINRLIPGNSFMIGTYSGLVTVSGAIGPMVSGILVAKGGSNIVQGFNNSLLMVVILSVIASILSLLFVKPDKINVKETSTLENDTENVMV
ncbi:sugar phosphate permease [Neobacillus bataviensis]|uniref:Sugar phosphate permease n=1 Tax=Neobacillus bataviensis TaxID=220685 RepID=A0A561CF91_9BACI|nr:MFS transporter [Neobacillus bataviensis]TWD89617.1 sugar phosphate permease [Neobacillus bataviensis]